MTRQNYSDAAAIVSELLELDPSLTPRRAELERLVGELQQSRPAADMRPAFERELRLRLRLAMKSEGETAPFSLLSFFLPMDTRYLFAGSGALVGALLVFAVTQGQSGWPALPTNEVANEPSITAVAPRAFGSLATQQAVGLGGGGGLGAGDESALSVRPQSGGGGDTEAAKDMMIMPPEEYRASRYVFDGALNLPTEPQSVYRRVKPTAKPSGQSAIADFARGLIDWSAFGNLHLQNVSLANSEYAVYIDYNEGSLSVNRIYDFTNRPDFRCQTPECYDQYRVKESDMPSDEEAFGIARSFATDLGIDLSVYGEPQISDNWQIMYARSTDKAAYWFPEQITVVFPLLLDGQPVYEEYGMPYGLNVSIDVRSKEAAGLYNHFVQRFDQSDYDPMTDEQRVRDAIRRGSVAVWEDPNANYVDVALGEPVHALMHQYQWNPENGQSTELFVPALVFPVTGQPANEYENRSNVVVPLVAEIYENADNMPQPIPMPLIQEEDLPATTDEAPAEEAVREEETVIE